MNEWIWSIDGWIVLIGVLSATALSWHGVLLAETARASAEAAIQMHGGMGVSEEVLATRLAQRLIASEFRYGDRLTHASRVLREDAATRAKQPLPAQDTHTRSA